MRSAEPTVRAQVVLPAPDLDETVAFFADRLGFRLLSIWPADDPRRAVMDGHGLCIELQRDGDRPSGVLRLLCREPLPGTSIGDVLTAPNGTRIELRPAEPAFTVPDGASSFCVSRADDGAEWVVGRAGMRYRDLLPDRQGGRFIASHIAIPDGGPVPDYVHYHRIRFQLIYCHRGWVRVVYEDQGEPFVLQAGDCVLQPPEIRHRVLEASPGLEVVELSCPAEHVTMVEHGFDLPTDGPAPRSGLRRPALRPPPGCGRVVGAVAPGRVRGPRHRHRRGHRRAGLGPRRPAGPGHLLRSQSTTTQSSGSSSSSRAPSRSWPMADAA